MQEQKYTYEDVTAYAVMGLFELINTVDRKDINLHTMVMIMEKIENKYTRDLIVDFACKLIEAERNSL